MQFFRFDTKGKKRFSAKKSETGISALIDEVFPQQGQFSSKEREGTGKKIYKLLLFRT